MAFKVWNSRKLNVEQQKQAIQEIKRFHQNIQEIENINNSIRWKNKQIRMGKETGKIEKELSSPKGAELIRNLNKKDLNYSKTNMYHDIRRNAMIYKSKSAEKSQRAQDWFDNYFEPFRKAKGLTTQEAHELWIKAKEQSYEQMSATDLEFALELREIGSPN